MLHDELLRSNSLASSLPNIMELHDFCLEFMQGHFLEVTVTGSSSDLLNACEGKK